MLDKLYILVALIVGICITVVMIVGGFSAAQWASTTFWLMISYLFIGLILRSYLKRKVFNEVEKVVIPVEAETIAETEVEEQFFVDDVEKAFFDDTDDE